MLEISITTYRYKASIQSVPSRVPKLDIKNKTK